MAYEIGTVTEGTVVEIAKFGAFIKMAGGKTGLVHISEISDKYVQEVGDFVSIGAKVLVKIITIDDRKRIQLSMKAVTPEDEEKYHLESIERLEKKAAPPPPPPRDTTKRKPEHSASARPEDPFEKKLKMFIAFWHG